MRVAHVHVEVLPQLKIFTQCSIAAARHITKNAIELEVCSTHTFLQVREIPGIVLCHEETRRVETTSLVGQHIGAFYIRIICDHEALVSRRF